MTVKTQWSNCRSTIISGLNTYFITFSIAIIFSWSTKFITSPNRLLIWFILMIKLECSRLMCMTWCLWPLCTLFLCLIWHIYFCCSVPRRFHVYHICIRIIFYTIWVISRFIGFMSSISCTSSSCCACWTSTNFIATSQIGLTGTSEKVL